KAEYDRLIAEWLGNRRRLVPPTAADGLTVAELFLAYWQWAERYYRDEHGELGQEPDNVRPALKPLRRLYGRGGHDNAGRRDRRPQARRRVLGEGVAILQNNDRTSLLVGLRGHVDHHRLRVEPVNDLHVGRVVQVVEEVLLDDLFLVAPEA